MEMNLEEYKRRSRGLETEDAKKGLIAHAVIVTAVGSLLTFINLNFMSEFVWFVFPIIGMTAGVLVHYLFSYRLAGMMISAKERRIEEWR